MNLRNIVDSVLVPHTSFQNGLTRLKQCFKNAKGCVEPVCIAVIGESRTGKSRCLEELRHAHRPRRRSDGLRVPILRVSTPSKPSVKGLVEVMLRNIGDPRFTAGSEQSKTGRLMGFMRECATLMIMIDEFQHFYDKVSHEVMHYVADWLKILVDDTKVCLVVAGLESCTAVIAQNEQLDGRFLSPILMPRFDWAKDEHREEFLGILSAFHEALSEHFQLPSLASDEMGFRSFCATGGLIGYLTKFLRQAVWNALDADTRIITLEDLALAHGQAVWSKLKVSDIPRPFERDFSFQPTQELLARIRLIGTPAPAVASPRASSSRKSASQGVSASLCAGQDRHGL